MFLIDTVTLSETIRVRQNFDVRRWLESTPPVLLFTSVIVVGEVVRGLTRHPDARREQWLATTLEQLEGRILPVTLAIAETWGEISGEALRRGVTLPIADSLIAATAIVHNLTVVTRNARDFERSGARVLNPWDAL